MKRFVQLYFIVLFMAFTAFNVQAQYAIYGANNPDVNGVYVESGTENGKPVYTNGNFYIYSKLCMTKWVINSSLDFMCPEYSTTMDGEVPPTEGWITGGRSSGNIDRPIIIVKANSIQYQTEAFIESVSDDGTFIDTINVFINCVENPLTGTNGEDFVATGKIVVSNLPSGLTAIVKRTSDNTLIAMINGSATDHTSKNSIQNLTFEFQNSAFTDNDASEIENSLKNDLKIMFMEKYLVYGASMFPEVNDTFKLVGFNKNYPIYSSDSHYLYYKGCQMGAKWAIKEISETCPVYTTRTDGITIPYTGWYDGGGGGGMNDTIFISLLNSLNYSKSIIHESDFDDGSIEDSIIITFEAPAIGNTFTGVNDDDFVNDGKVIVSNLPVGLTTMVTRKSDTSLLVKFTGNATNHEFNNSIDDLSFEFQNSAFSSGDAATVKNYLKSNLNISFIQKYEVIGATSTPGVNGTYISSGTINDKLIYSKGVYRLGYRGCSNPAPFPTSKWVIVDGDDNNLILGGGNCPLYSTSTDGEVPPYDGWHQGGGPGSGDTIYVIPHNSLYYSKTTFIESIADDGSIDNSDTLIIKYLYPQANATFSGVNNDDFVADGKIIISDLPTGLVAVAKRTSDSSLAVVLTGTATGLGINDNIINLTFEFQNSAFSHTNASLVGNYINNDLKINIIQKYEVIGATSNPEVNGTYITSGLFNDKPVYSKGEYRLGYRGCNNPAPFPTTKWVIVDGDDNNLISGGNCPLYSNTTVGEVPPYHGWHEGGGPASGETIYVIPHNSLYYSKTTFIESLANDGSIDNTDTLIIRYLFPESNAAFSGANNDDFVVDGKVTISNLPGGLTASVKRTNDTTLTVVINGSTIANDINDLTFTFSNEAFTNIDASNVFFSSKDNFKIDFHNEYYVASSGGDFSTIDEAVSDLLVKDGDILILAAETFTELGIVINKSLTIKGQGAGKTIIQAHANPFTAGGRIFNMLSNPFSTKNVTLEDMTLQNGNSGGQGGCMYSQFYNLTIKKCEIKNNRTTSYRGGAISSSYGSFVVENSTFSNNSVVYGSISTSYGGGAIYLETPNVSDSSLISNCTFNDNSVSNQYGGALNTNHNLKIKNSTFANNAAIYGGAIYRSGREIDMVNVLVADNTATTGGNDIWGSLNANYCFIEDIAGATIDGTNNVSGVDPELSTLSDNGGSTQTCAISATSQAKDVGTEIDVPLTDQRGVEIYNSIKDIGAYEYNIEPVIISSVTNLEFGNVEVADSMELSYTISAINLTNDLVVTAPTGFEISGFSGSEFVGLTSMTMIPNSGSVNDTVIFVKYIATTTGAVSEIITNSSTDAEIINISVKVNAVSKPSSDNSSVLIPQNISKTFAENDFDFDDQDGGEFVGIKIITNETDGDLEYRNINVTDGTICSDISRLVFKPFANEWGVSYATFTFKVIDNSGLYSASDYTMTIMVNDSPVVSNSIPDGDAQVGVAYTYEVAENTYTDVNVGDVLSLSASLSDDSDLPAWLSFNGLNRIFSGTPDASGEVTIKVTATDIPLATVSEEFVLTIAAGTGIDNGLNNNILVYPNPAKDVLKVSLSKLDLEMKIQIVDITGKVIYNNSLQSKITEIDLSDYTKGMYFIQLYNNNEITTRKIIIE